MTALALEHVEFDSQRGRQALEEGFTQATDLAEALVRRGVPFREAYKAVGALVSMAVAEGVSLRAVGAGRAQQIHPVLDAESLRVLDPATAVAAKESSGGTGPRSTDGQIAWLRERASDLSVKATGLGSLEVLAQRVFAEPLELA